jgi:hypothetical protein|tara:strand:+ start:1329 stop:1877 length:549 start_codon:yes stop_codon:yes gene_type:complete
MSEALVEIDEDFEVDANDIKVAIDLASMQLKLETEVDDIEQQLKEKKIALREVQEKLLPEALDQLDMNDLHLPGGGSVKLKADLTISVPKARMHEITDWLTHEGHEGLIKAQIVVPFEKGQSNKVGELQQHLSDIGLTSETITSINSATLKALLKEQMEAGQLNKDLGFFGAFAWKRAIVKR